MFLKQDSWGVGEKNMMNPFKRQTSVQLYKKKCHRPIRAAGLRQ